ncbi:MAG: winged helix DNA-binding domain-containing protein [Mycobacteriales bacterium]
MPTTIGPRAVNRATLERQSLLRRAPVADVPVAAAIERLVGLQAQLPNPPYVGLWSRLDGFTRDALETLVRDRRVVRTGLMRATLHLVTADDMVRLRPVLQPVLARAQKGHFGARLAGVDPAELAAVGRELYAGKALTQAELRRHLDERWPGRDPEALAYSVNYLTPVVQAPPGGLWGRQGSIPYTLADTWLDRPVAGGGAAPDTLFLRYLAAFGPASVADVQAWSGLTRLREVADRLRPGLRVLRDEAGRELLDVPEGPLPDPDTPAPVRFLPEYDNLIVGYADRGRMVPDAHRARICAGPFIAAAVLVDGTARGSWRFARRRDGTAVMEVELFERLARREAGAVEAEAGRLLRFAAPDAETHDVRVRGINPQEA